MPRERKKPRVIHHYNVADLVDAPEHYPYSRSMGILTWGTWDHEVRPFEQRAEDFRCAFPPDDPVKFIPGGDLVRQADGRLGQAAPSRRLERFLQADWRPGSLHDLLARYGLKLRGGPLRVDRPFVPAPLRDTARNRNVKLRVLHGGVDVEPANMDQAKAEYLDRQEKTQAAKDVRAAIQRMNDDLGGKR